MATRRQTGLTMTREDAPEDLAAHDDWRAQANNASGWNGSLELYRHDNHQGNPCPEHYLRRIKAARDAAAQREAGRARA